MMKQFKGTKGEWKAFRPAGSNGFYYVEVGSGIHSVNTATCYNPNGESEDETEVAANAKLISAAPELLEALQDLIIHSLENDMHSEFTDKAKKAIEKALK